MMAEDAVGETSVADGRGDAASVAAQDASSSAHAAMAIAPAVLKLIGPSGGGAR